tara:strand:- start:35 stop:439 length:405 start_codon:yes stop_codon:yes gene_type:complete
MSGLNSANNYKNINSKNWIKWSANILILYTNYLTVLCFLEIYSIGLNLNNPIISKGLIMQIIAPYVKLGLILTIGLFLILIIRFLKQQLISAILSLLLVLFYHTNEKIPNFEGNTEIQDSTSISNVSFSILLKA